MKTIYRTGDAAKLIGCAPRTIAKWCDSGELRSYRLNQDRRIPRESLIDFLRSRGMPLRGLVPRIVLVTQDSMLADSLREGAGDDVIFAVAGDEFGAGQESVGASGIVADYSIGAEAAWRVLWRSKGIPGVALTLPGTTEKPDCHISLEKPVAPRVLLRHILDAIGF